MGVNSLSKNKIYEVQLLKYVKNILTKKKPLHLQGL